MVASPGFAYYDNTKILPKIASEVPSIEKFVIMDDIEGKYVLFGQLDRSARYEEYISQAGSSGLPSVSISPHDMVNVQFTSGEEEELPRKEDFHSQSIDRQHRATEVCCSEFVQYHELRSIHLAANQND